jgi:UDP-N-acetylmuramoylalanine--D-glutamate ligase
MARNQSGDSVLDYRTTFGYHWYRFSEISMTRRNLVIGLGVSGQSACQFLRRRGEEVYAFDDRPSGAVVAELEALGVQVVTFFPCGVDRVIVSPGVPPSQSLYRTSRERGLPVIGEIELGLNELNTTVIGVTGSNGKTTTTRLIEHVLRKCGVEAMAMGNIGLPITGAIDQMATCRVAVVELSSFQLDTMESTTLDYALLLNLFPNHLDRYGTFEQYAAAKWRMAQFLKPSGEFIIPVDLAHPPLACTTTTFGLGSHAHYWTDFSRVLCNGNIELLLESSHRELVSRQRENLMAAYAVSRQLGIQPSAFFEAVMTFKSPPHRIEPVGSLKGVAFVNDSKGTNSIAVRRALGAVAGPILLIAGGRSKENGFAHWAEWLSPPVRHLFAIGEAAPRLVAELQRVVPVTACANLEEAVVKAYATAREGETVLLSPGGSSWDAYRNFEERGTHFKEIVFKLMAQHSNSGSKAKA